MVGTSTQRFAFAQLVGGRNAHRTSLKLTGCLPGVEVYDSKPKIAFTSPTDDAFVVTYREVCGGATHSIMPP